MAHLIDKSDLVAEIERMRDKAFSNSDWNHGYVKACESFISFINTLEVKAEKDLELTWKDLALIEKIGNDFIKENDTPMDDKEFFEEVLKRFKERKEK